MSDIVKPYCRAKKIAPIEGKAFILLLKKAQSNKNGHLKARRSIIEANIGLVRKEAKRWLWALDFEEAFDQGILGMFPAIRKYRPSKGAFSTYAMFWVRASIQRYVNDVRGIVRVPQYAETARQKYQKLSRNSQETDEFWMKFVEKESGVSRQSMAFAIMNSKPATSLSAPADDDHDGPIEIGVVDDSPGFAQMDAAKLLSFLNEKYREILRRRMEGETLKDIGLDLGVSRERIRQVESHAIQEIRSIIKSTDLQYFR